MPLDEFVRIEGDKYQLPVVTMQRGERVVVLIGMMHIASPKFFTDVEVKLLKFERAGYKILYEFLDPDVWAASPEEKVALQEKRGKIVEALKPYGLTYQTAAISLRQSWVSADISEKEWQKDPQSHRSSVSNILESLDKLIEDPQPYLKQIEMGLRSAHEYVNSFVSSPTGAFVLSFRDRAGVTKILEHVCVSNVATYWGAAHVPGFVRILEENGFKIVFVDWLAGLASANLQGARV